MSQIVNGNGGLTQKPVIRLCQISKWADYDGYGFNLHAEKSKPGQFIGKVDEGSPAEAAGLKEGDRIVEVNGQNIAGEDHKSVVNKIKQHADETSLLVVDKESADYFHKNNITVTSSLPEVVTMKTPAKPEQNINIVNGNGVDKVDGTENGNIVENGSVTENGSSTPSDTNKTSSIASESPKSQKSATSSEGSKDEKGKLNLNMSATEFRNKLALRKKYDPKKENIDVKKKYDIIDQL